MKSIWEKIENEIHSAVVSVDNDADIYSVESKTTNSRYLNVSLWFNEREFSKEYRISDHTKKGVLPLDLLDEIKGVLDDLVENIPPLDLTKAYEIVETAKAQRTNRREGAAKAAKTKEEKRKRQLLACEEFIKTPEFRARMASAGLITKAGTVRKDRWRVYAGLLKEKYSLILQEEAKRLYESQD